MDRGNLLQAKSKRRGEHGLAEERPRNEESPIVQWYHSQARSVPMSTEERRTMYQDGKVLRIEEEEEENNEPEESLENRLAQAEQEIEEEINAQICAIQAKSVTITADVEWAFSSLAELPERVTELYERKAREVLPEGNTLKGFVNAYEEKAETYGDFIIIGKAEEYTRIKEENKVKYIEIPRTVLETMQGVLRKARGILESDQKLQELLERIAERQGIATDNETMRSWAQMNIQDKKEGETICINIRIKGYEVFRYFSYLAAQVREYESI